MIDEFFKLPDRARDVLSRASVRTMKLVGILFRLHDPLFRELKHRHRAAERIDGRGKTQRNASRRHALDLLRCIGQGQPVWLRWNISGAGGPHFFRLLMFRRAKFAICRSIHFARQGAASFAHTSYFNPSTIPSACARLKLGLQIAGLNSMAFLYAAMPSRLRF